MGHKKQRGRRKAAEGNRRNKGETAALRDLPAPDRE